MASLRSAGSRLRLAPVASCRFRWVGSTESGRSSRWAMPHTRTGRGSWKGHNLGLGCRTRFSTLSLKKSVRALATDMQLPRSLGQRHAIIIDQLA